MLQFIISDSDKAKTDKLREIIIEKSKKNKNIMLIVPEQFSFSSECAMLRLMGNMDYNKIKVVSFKRLCRLVFKEYGGLAGESLDDTAKNILMSLAIEEVEDKLTIYKSKNKNVELVSLMLDAVKEFKDYEISANSLNKIAFSIDNEFLRDKLSQTALVMQAYEALIERSFVDPDDDLKKLYVELSENNFFNGYDVFIDLFTGFTSWQFKALEQIFNQAKSVTIGFCVDNIDNLRTDQLDLFTPVKKTIIKIKNIAADNNIKIIESIKVKDTNLNADIIAIKNQIFKQKKLPVMSKGNTKVYFAKNIYDEINHVALNIKRLVIESRYRYKDISVTCRNLDPYKEIIKGLFKKFDIPFFIDAKETLYSKPIVKLIMSAFDILNNNFNTDDIMRFLKTGLTDISFDDISLLENYALLWNISSMEWQKDFVKNPNGFKEKFSDSDKAELEQINIIRKQVVTPLLKFKERTKEKTAKAISSAIYNLLIEIKCTDKIKDMSVKLKNANEFNLSQEQLRLWDILMNILNQFAVILNDNIISYKRYQKLLSIVLNSKEISFVSKGIDCVNICTADRTRLNNPKVSFVIGVVEGEFPKNQHDTGIFTPKERQKLISLGIDIRDSFEQQALDERLTAYLALTSADDKLFISWHKLGSLCEEKLPSPIIFEIKKIFKNLEIKDEFSYSTDDLLWTKEQGFSYLFKVYKDDSLKTNTIREYYANSSEYSKQLSLLDNLIHKKDIKFENPNKAKQLFGENMRVSPSQIETFYLCKFKYFCRYGLLAKERKKTNFDALVYGNVIHFVLEKIFKNHSIKDLSQLSQNSLILLTEKTLNEYVNTYLGGLKDKKPRFIFLFKKLIKNASFLISHVANQLTNSNFVPTGFEVNIGEDISPLIINLKDGATVSIAGKIDRVDKLKLDDKNYLRVVDYKTGNKEFHLSDILYGLNMQMAIYLNAVCKNNKANKIIPAGIFYMPASRPVVDCKRYEDEIKAVMEIDKKLTMDGLILDDPAVISSIEKENPGNKKYTSLIDIAQIGQMMKKVELLIKDMAETIRKGDISSKPSKGKKYDACEYCEFSKACFYNENECIQIEDLKFSEAVKKLSEVMQSEE